MGKTSIEWTGETWNPTRGCKMISPGCSQCYAMKQAGRFSGAGRPYEGLVTLGAKGKGFHWTGEFREVPEALDIPLRRRAPTTYFVDSMSDLFGEGVSNEFIAAVFGVMAATPRHTYQVLTKRAARLPEWFHWLNRESLAPEGVSVGFAKADRCLVETEIHAVAAGFARPHLGDPSIPWPLPNVHLGVSVEDRKHGLPRIDDLRKVPAAVRFLSIEPLLEDLGEIDLTGIHWVIVGGESGPGARPFNLAWARSIIRQCKAAQIPCFVKQMGARVLGRDCEHGRAGKPCSYTDPKGGDPSEWPADLRVREMPQVRR